MLGFILKIVIVVEIYRHWLFFRRFADSFSRLGVSAAIVTPLISVFKEARPRFEVKLARNTFSGSGGHLFSEHDIRSGKLTHKQSRRLCDNIYSALMALGSIEPVTQLWIWNGLSSAGVAATRFADDKAVETRFFELANITGKLFVDPKGVNIQSQLHAQPERLDYPADLQKFRAWKDAYLELKYSQHIVPQSFRLKKVMWAQWIDMLAQYFGLVQLSDRIDLLKTFAPRISVRIAATAASVDHDPFIFFPFQVSTDTQLTINSTIDNRDALLICSERARAKGLSLVVKFHPAESDHHYMKSLYTLIHSVGALISQDNTFDLIRKAREVVVINSTVGLESLLIGKETTFLGRSLFACLSDENRLANYINDYLIDLEYFSEEPVSMNTLRKLINFNHPSPILA